MRTLLAVLLVLTSAPARAGVDPSFGAPPEEKALRAAAQKLVDKMTPAASPDALFSFEALPNGRPVLIIKPSQMERSFLFAATLEKGTGENGVYSTTNLPTFVFAFHWAGDKVQVLRKDVSRRAPAGSAEEKALANSFPDTIFATLPVAAADPAKGFAVPIEALVLSDLFDLASLLKKTHPGSPDVRLVQQESTLEFIKVFPKNVELRVQLVFGRSEAGPSAVSSDGRRLPLTVQYSLSELPDAAGFETRRADERVGNFTTQFRDYTHNGLLGAGGVDQVALVDRWRLEKKEPDAPVSDVKEPVVFWIEDTVPERYRPSIRAGILAWNAAFEAAGLRNAIVVKEVDKDMPADERAVFDPANAAYNMVRWFMGEGASFAQGPSRVDPRTGEILNATLRIGDDRVRLYEGGSLTARQRPAAADGHQHGPWCFDLMAQDAAAGLAALQSRGALSEAERKRYDDEFMTRLIAHETGHTLGLAHNFRASRMFGHDQLGTDGLIASSVMDYFPTNIAPAGKPQGPYYQQKVGPYDFWAIEYAYKPLAGDAASRAAQLKAVADRSETDPRLAYGGDYDVGSDPDVQRYDLGRSATGFARERAALAREIWTDLEARAARGDGAAVEMRRQFGHAFHWYDHAVGTMLPYIGGVRTPRGKDYQPVGAAEQREVLKAIDELVLSASFEASPALLRRMGVDRLKTPQPAGPVSAADLGAGLQKETLDALHDADLHRRIASANSLTAPGQDRVTTREVLDVVRASVWKETSTPGALIPAARRRLQNAHIDALVKLAGDESAGDETRLAARAVLTAVFIDAGKAAQSVRLDEYTRLHLGVTREMIARAVSTAPAEEERLTASKAKGKPKSGAGR